MKAESPADPRGDTERSSETRRAFLDGVARKATFVVPVVVTLKAQTAFAAGSRATSCTPSFAACTTDAECCSGVCIGGGMQCQMGV